MRWNRVLSHDNELERGLNWDERHKRDQKDDGSRHLKCVAQNRSLIKGRIKMTGEKRKCSSCIHREL